MCGQSFKSCATLCDPMDCNPPGSSVHGILQARILEWVAIPSPGDRPNPGIKSVSLMSPALADRFFTTKGFSGGSDSKMSACSVGDPGSIPGL